MCKAASSWSSIPSPISYNFVSQDLFPTPSNSVSTFPIFFYYNRIKMSGSWSSRSPVMPYSSREQVVLFRLEETMPSAAGCRMPTAECGIYLVLSISSSTHLLHGSSLASLISKQPVNWILHCLSISPMRRREGLRSLNNSHELQWKLCDSRRSACRLEKKPCAKGLLTLTKCSVCPIWQLSATRCY